MPPRLRVFVSSPADVPAERLRADLIIDKLSDEYSRFFAIESYRWEHEAMLASKHFQDAIEPPSAFDIVVLILWSRLGTPLPERTAEREYHGIDGRVPVTGTEWEYEEALQAAREKGAPDLLAFRNIGPAPIDTRDSKSRARSNAQLDALDQFWRRHFADRGAFLAAYDEYRTLEEFAHRLEQSLRKLIERRVEGMSAGTGRIWPGDPFRGLESYEFDHAPIFFGRNTAVMKATEQLAGGARAGCAFLLVSGASGSGKSSLVKAGVVPRLMKPQRISGMAIVRRAVFRPGSEGADVILGLAKALTRVGGQDVGLPELIAPGQNAAQLAIHLRSAVGDPGYLFANALGRLTVAGRESHRLLAFEDAKLILVVDQLEELFTVPGIGTEERRLFIQLLAGLARSGAVWVIATIRADFWHRGADIPELVALAEGLRRIDLAAPSPAELAEMIRKPAQAAGLSFEVHPESRIALDAVLAADAAEAPGALPLLSFTLDELYKDAKARGEAVLSHTSYAALGGLEGAIASRADAVVAGLPAAAQAALPRVLRALTTIASTAEQAPVARWTPLASFAEGSPARMLIDAFIAARLLVAGSDRDAPPMVRLAHEALIGCWQHARDQLAVDRRDLETRTLVERQLGRWRRARKRERRLLLLRNPDLANAVDLARRWGDELDAPLRDFITRSASRARLVQTLTAAAAVVFALVAGAAFYSQRQAVRAQHEADVAAQQALRAQHEADVAAQQALRAQRETERRQVNLLAELATSERLQGNLDAALKLGIHAAHLGLALDPNQTEMPAPRAALASAVWESDWRLMFGGRDNTMRSAAFSPDGSRIVTSGDNTARIWDAASGKEIVVLRGHEGYVSSAAFSPDGSHIITASEDKSVRIWDAGNGMEVTAFKVGAKVHSACFSPDGSRLAIAASHDAGIFDARSGKMIAFLKGHEGEVWSAAFSPDGLRVVTASNDNTARIWDATSGTEIAVLRHSGAVSSAAFSPDGSHIVTASTDATRVWDAAGGKVVLFLKKHSSLVYSAVFSPDGSHVVTASDDHTALIWDAGDGEPIVALRGHEGPVMSVAFSPDGSRIVTASRDGTARLWNAAGGNEVTVLRGHEDGVWSASSSPGGSRIVTASSDHTARIWDAGSGKEILVLRGHEDWVPSAAFSPDEKRIATASFDKTARIWDAASGKEIAVLRGHEDKLWSAAFSPNGSRIVTASNDNTARIWDAGSGKEILVLRGHKGIVSSAAFSPDGSRVVTAGAGDNTPRIWDEASGRELALLRGHSAGVWSAAFNRNGTRVVTASMDTTARIWDATTATEIAVLRGHNTVVQSATFSPDGTRIVTASWDGTARIWDATTGREIAVLGHSASVHSAAFTSDGNRIVTASSDKTVRIWNVRSATMSTKDLIIEACTRRLRGLTRLSPGETRVAGYPDTTPAIDVCAGIE